MPLDPNDPRVQRLMAGMDRQQAITGYQSRYASSPVSAFLGDANTVSRGSLYGDAVRAYEASNARRAASVPTEAGTEDDGAARAEQDWQEIRDLTIGARQDVLNDPTLSQAQDVYRQTIDQGGPLTDDLVGRMQARVDAESLARADYERRQMGRQMERQNLRPGDPGYQASLRDVYLEDLRRRQGARNDLAIQQAMTNYGARTGAASALSSARMGQLGMANQLGLAGAGHLGLRVNEDPNNPSRVNVDYPTYSVSYQTGGMPALPVPQQVINSRTGTQRAPIPQPQNQAPAAPSSPITPAPGSAIRTYDQQLPTQQMPAPTPIPFDDNGWI